MKKLVGVISAVLLCASCTVMSDGSLLEDGLMVLSTKSEADKGIWSYYDYCSETGFWAQFTSLEERLTAVRVPEDILRKCCTMDLIALCVANPMANIYSAYNNELVGIDVVADHINVFTELEKREDAASALVEFYSKVTVAPNRPAALQLIDGQFSLSLLSCNFLELYLASGRVPSLFNEENKSSMLSSIERLYKYKRANPGVFSWYSYSKELLLKDVLAFGDNATPEQAKNIYQQRYSCPDIPETKVPGDGNTDGGSMRSFPVSTKGGKQVSAFLKDEMSETELQDIYSYDTSLHPNAEVRGPATATYNCHSYAWYITDNELSYTPCWISRGIQNEIDEDNLSRYWTNDYYSEVSSEAIGEKIYYRGDDHSAIKDIDGDYYISKWGIGPRMKHHPSDCPYSMVDMHYYAHVENDNNDGLGDGNDGSGGNMGGTGAGTGGIEPINPISLSIDGPISIHVGQSYTYTTSQMFDTELLEWTCSAAGLQITPSTGRTVSVCAENAGRYVLKVTYNMYGEVLGSGRLIIDAE